MTIKNQDGHTYGTYCAHMAAQQVTPMRVEVWERECLRHKTRGTLADSQDAREFYQREAITL